MRVPYCCVEPDATIGVDVLTLNVRTVLATRDVMRGLTKVTLSGRGCALINAIAVLKLEKSVRPWILTI